MTSLSQLRPPPLLPHPSSLSGERYHLPHLLPSLELENFNFPSSADGARGLMSITQALKQELTWTWSELSALWQHYLTPRTSAASFSVSLHLFICFPPATPLRSLLSLFSDGIVMSRVEIPVKKKKKKKTWLDPSHQVHYDPPPLSCPLTCPSRCGGGGS